MPNREVYRANTTDGKTLQWLNRRDVNFLKKNKKNPREAHSETLRRLLNELRAYRRENNS